MILLYNKILCHITKRSNSIPGGASKTSPKNISVLGLFSILTYTRLLIWEQNGSSSKNRVFAVSRAAPKLLPR